MDGIYGSGTITLPLSWLTSLATSDARMAVFGLRGLYGVVRCLHLIAMAGFVGMVLLLDLRGLGLFPRAALDPVRARLGLVLKCCFWVTIATGAGLFIYDPLGVGLHTMFLPKLLLVIFGYVLSRARRHGPLRRAPQLTASVSLAIWLLVIGASTWNHVERPVRVGAALRASSIGKE
jgi:hypothetical protein